MFEPLIKHITNFSPMKSKCVLTFKFRAQKLFLMLLKKIPSLLWKIYLYKIFLFILHYKYPKQSILIKPFMTRTDLWSLKRILNSWARNLLCVLSMVQNQKILSPLKRGVTVVTPCETRAPSSYLCWTPHCKHLGINLHFR